MRILAVAIVALGVASTAGQAQAQTYDPAFPVCMYVVSRGGGGYYDCSYYTMAQCAASASGRPAQCNPNPYFAGKAAWPRRNDWRYRQLGSIAD